MKKVKYIGHLHNELTYGKIYDVIHYFTLNDNLPVISILSDIDEVVTYHFNTLILFKDVTKEYRNDIINNILI